MEGAIQTRLRCNNKVYWKLNNRMMDFLVDLWHYLKERKKWWLLPLMVILLFFGLLIVLSGGSAVAPFIYTLF